MRSTTTIFEGGTATRFVTDQGNVVVIVRPDGDEAVVEVYEEQAVRAACGKSDADFAGLAATLAARNHFGTGLMLRILREVKAAYPRVRKWRGHRIPIGRV